MPTPNDEPGRQALLYNPSVVSWALADVVARPPSVLLRVSVYVLLLTLVGAGIFAHYSTVALTVSGRGLVRNSGKIRPVRAPVSGKVAEILVKNGSLVKKGDPLVEMENLVGPRELERIRAMMQRVHALAAAGDSREVMTEAGVLVQEPLRMTGPVLVQERSRLSEAINAVYMALRQVHEAVPGQSAADAAERAAAEAKIAKIHASHLEQELRSDLAELERVVARLKVSMHGRRESAGRQLEGARAALEVQAKTFEESLRAQVESLRVLAPVGGSVSNLALTGPGELIAAGANLLELIPEGAQLVAEVQIANKDIAQLRVGLPVKVKLDAFPYQDFGVVSGRLVEIPEDAAPAQKDAPPVYVVTVALDRGDVDGPNGGPSHPLKLGMTLTADIQTRKRTLLQLALVEVLKLKEIF